jgi:hypothetical protein
MDMEMAAKAKDVSALMKLMMGSGNKSNSEIVKQCMNTLEFFYYQYFDGFGDRPRDIDDMIGGIIFIELKAYFTKKSLEKPR